MLKIIEPHVHECYGQKIDSLLGLLKIYQNLYLFPTVQDRATFIIAEDDKRGPTGLSPEGKIYGGAVLYPCKLSSSLKFMPEDTHDEKLGKLFSSFQPNVKEYWTARICLCLGHDVSTPLLESIQLYQHFYRNLYKAFCYFGEKENIDYLTFTLRSTEADVDNKLRLLTYQLWPHLLEVRVSDNPDGYFHGILSLKGKAFKIPHYTQKFLKPHASSQTSFMAEVSFSKEGRAS